MKKRACIGVFSAIVLLIFCCVIVPGKQITITKGDVYEICLDGLTDDFIVKGYEVSEKKWGYEACIFSEKLKVVYRINIHGIVMNREILYFLNEDIEFVENNEEPQSKEQKIDETLFLNSLYVLGLDENDVVNVESSIGENGFVIYTYTTVYGNSIVVVEKEGEIIELYEEH